MKYYLAVLLTCIGVWQSAAQAGLPQSVETALKKSGIANSGMAIYIQPVDGGPAIVSYNAQTPMNPASVMKLVTTYAALDILSPAFRWKTEVLHDGTIENGVLKGNLMIKGRGDPTFKAADFWQLLMRIKQSGIQRIDGDLLIDKSFFATGMADAGAFDGERWRAYNAPPSALLVNGRNTSFRFSVMNGQVMVDQEFELPEVTIINNMRLNNGGCGSWRNHFTYDVTQSQHGAIVTFTGKFSARCGTRYLELSALDDTQYAFYTFKKLWAEIGGQFNGGLQVGIIPLNAVEILTHESQPLGYAIYDLNKWSINVMARQLLLTIAAEQFDEPATEALGEAAVKSWLSAKGLKFNELVIENGSGLSRIARINAKNLATMLIDAYQGPVMSELIASMPILSNDGTVKKRLRNTDASGHAHLKTGSLSGVSAIAGYVLSAQKKRYVVVVIANDARAYASKKVQDAVIEWVYETQ